MDKFQKFYRNAEKLIIKIIVSTEKCTAKAIKVRVKRSIILVKWKWYKKHYKIAMDINMVNYSEILVSYKMPVN